MDWSKHCLRLLPPAVPILGYKLPFFPQIMLSRVGRCNFLMGGVQHSTRTTWEKSLCTCNQSKRVDFFPRAGNTRSKPYTLGMTARIDFGTFVFSVPQLGPGDTLTPDQHKFVIEHADSQPWSFDIAFSREEGTVPSSVYADLQAFLSSLNPPVFKLGDYRGIYVCTQAITLFQAKQLREHIIVCVQNANNFGIPGLQVNVKISRAHVCY